MAYTSAPETQTYGSHKKPLVYNMQVRPYSRLFDGYTTDLQDEGMVNVLPAKWKDSDFKDEVIGLTRPPIHAYRVGASGVNRGCYVWEKSVGTTYYFMVVDTGVYTSTDGTTWSAIPLFNLLTNVTTPVRFTEFIDATNTKKLVMVDGVEGYVFTSNTAYTKITDVDFPNPHIPFPVFMDGYLYLAKAGTGDIYNSNLNDPTLWTAGDFISSELYPDDVQALVKVDNYLLAVGTQGCEYFYDAANATASPLARVEGAALPFGTQIPNSIASNKDTVVMIANNNDGEATIVKIKGQKYEEIDPSFLIPLIAYRLVAPFNSTTAAKIRGFFFRTGGKLFYALALDGVTITPNLGNGTFVYSFDTGWWEELRSGDTGQFPFPVRFSTMSTSGVVSTFVSGHAPLDGSSGSFAFFGKLEEGTTSPFSRTSTDQYISSGSIVYSPGIYQELRTPNLDFDTLNQKTMSRVGFAIQEYVSGGSTTTPSITVDWNDADYALTTWSSSRSCIIGAGLDFPFLTQLGKFRRRAFRIKNTSGYFLQYFYLEADINKGQQ